MYTLSWKLLIIELFSKYFPTLHLKEIATKCSIFLHQLYFFLMRRSRMFFFFFGIRIKCHLGRAKGSGKRGYEGRGPKWGGFFFFFCKFLLLIKWDTSFISQTIAQTSKHHYCVWTCPKTYKQRLSSDFEQFFLAKNNFSIFKEQVWLPRRRCYGENIVVLTRKKCSKMAWHSTHTSFWMCQFQWHRFWHCTFWCF